MWKTEWEAISARIASLLEAGNYFWRTIAAGENDNYSASDELIRNAEGLVNRIEQFQLDHRTQLPDLAAAALQDFITRYQQSVRAHVRPNGVPGTQGALTLLASFLCEFNHLLADSEAVGRSLVTRAFLHLQRTIVADSTVKEKWEDAFQEHETACEKLGSVHLLLHGVWAFKVSTAGERTDLVLGTSLLDNPDLRAAADTLVLTEWKLVKSEGQLNAKIREAYNQANRYSLGALAGFELASRRYVVIVSSDHLPMPQPLRTGNVTYEHINVAVSPSTPSTTRRRVPARGKRSKSIQ